MKKINETKVISDLLGSSIFGEIIKSDKFNLMIKYSTIFSFWEEVVGKKFIKYTKPYAIKSSKLYVSAKSPIIAQELSLYKQKLLLKINSYSMALDIKIKDIIFDYKNFDDLAKQNNNNEIEDKPIYLKLEEIEKIKLDNNIQQIIKNNISKINMLNEEQKSVFLKKILNNYKAKQLQEK